MRVTFPRMGNSHIPLRALFESAGVEVVLPPPSSRRTVALGARHSPEFACFPLKLNIGNFIEAAESGADTMVMAGGIGPCRFGYYAQVEREILADMGFDLEMVVLEPPCTGWVGLASRIRKITGGCGVTGLLRAARLAWVKCGAVDEIESVSRKARPVERSRGAVTRAMEEALALLDDAGTVTAARKALAAGCEMIWSATGFPVDDPEPIRVGIVGEIFMVLDGFSNMDVERRLGEMGVEVHRFLSMGEWVRSNLLPKSFMPHEAREMVALASPYLNYFVGGHGVESVGGVRVYARLGFDGVVQIMPFTCMPEIVAQSVLKNVSRDHSIPVLTLSLDEHTAEAGLQTRLEAFVDLLKRRRVMKAAGRTEEGVTPL
ncbi:MAG: CoA protein activase [Firmicutes bacterium]|nr:CoA protein activase [Bacillota bacterium]